jgi:hypothetical protein
MTVERGSVVSIVSIGMIGVAGTNLEFKVDLPL